MPRAAVHTLGCRLNQAESALLADAFRTRGYEIVRDSDPADLYVINSCSVTRGAEAKCRRLVRYLLKRTPEAHVVVTGCYAQLDAEALAAIDGVDLVVGTEEKHKLPDLVGSLEKRPETEIRKIPMSRDSFTLPETGLFHETRANLKIQDGCDVFCSFCVIPYTRGRQRSRVLADCIRETGELAKRGHQEVVVTGVNIGTYMEGGADFAGLLDDLSEVPGVGRLRISSIEPMTVDDSVIELMARNPKICPYLHLCLQSGDDAILETMKRPYTAAEYRSLLLEIVARVPNVGIGTDIIVGFPGETEESFEKTYSLLEELPFYHFHVFSYSEHARTRSARMPEKIQPEIVKKRSEKVRRLGQLKKQQFHEAQIGRTLNVLFERRDKRGRLVGHAENYASVSVDDPRDLTNRIVPVSVQEADVDEVRGEAMVEETIFAEGWVTA